MSEDDPKCKVDSFPSGPPMISLITCTLGRSDALEKLARSVNAQTCKRIEWIIIDKNADGAIVRNAVRDSDLRPRIFRQEDPSASAGRNLGIAMASAPVVGFPDDDCWYSPDFIASVLNRFDRDPELEFVTGMTLGSDGAPSLGRYLSRKDSARINLANAHLCGNANVMFARTELMRSVKFDEKLGPGRSIPTAEDYDLICRMAQRYRAVFFPDMVVWHESNDWTVKMQRAWNAGYAMGWVWRKNRVPMPTCLSLLIRPALASLIALSRFDRRDFRYRCNVFASRLAGWLAPQTPTAATRDSWLTGQMSQEPVPSRPCSPGSKRPNEQ